MDNMLYIIAGLIIILVIGVWILRKNKAQRPTSQPISDSVLPPVSAAPVQREAANNMNTATLFDDVTVAQRFIDQQRYDKAIETLERGLSEKPNDSALSLKLLNVYALSNDTEAFYHTYAAINAHGDRITIAQAQQLKELLDAEKGSQAPLLSPSSSKPHMAADIGTATEPNLAAPVHANTHHSANDTDAALDFDFASSTPAANSDSAVIAAVTQDIEPSDSPINSTFDLTLDDLEATDNVINIAPAPSLGTQDDTDTLAATATQSSTMDTRVAQDDLALDFEAFNFTKNSEQLAPIVESPVNNTETQSENEFQLDFDAFLDDVTDTAKTEIEQEALLNHDVPETLANNDDFDLDFAEFSTLELQNEPTLDTSAPSVVDSSIDNSNDDFLLSANATISTDNYQSLPIDIISEPDAAPVADTMLSNSSPTNDLELIDFDFDFDIATDTNDNLEDHSALTTTRPTVTIVPDRTLTFDDDTDIDELNFNIDLDEQATESSSTVGSVTPVTSPVMTDEAATDFAEQFATDFAFVDTLDSQQVTLDLAGQYLQLGEYDSANRLLNEVVAQGNPEQQAQAQALLARTT
ncbi:FimV/HubP family polar landmark protein [Psychrobacter sp. 16-MNA-CIBAN-0192]|uniref:FimV/HubP family polar landmark protein n=1 Tax=Psychrobacter sp. 16-MNA-CIBAN-0192 TaxID=3140448 RepID=UPI003324CDA2